MDRLDKTGNYRHILQQVIERHARLTASDREIESIPICDTTHDHYLLMSLGWDRVGRAHDILVHLRLKDGKVWIEWDGIEDGIARDLIEAGIPKEDILFALQSREPQPMAELIAA